MDSELVTYERHDGIGRITLNRPDKLNAISDEMNEALCAAFHRFDDDDDAWVGIVSGNGRAFCSGADVRQRQLRTPEEMKRLGGPAGRGTSLTACLYRSTHSKPLIAAVHGYVLGAGLLLALLCDVLVAADDARFQIAEIKRGLNGGHFRALLAQRAWAGFADEVAITGRMWSAQEGLEKGIVQYLASAGEHLAMATQVASQILENPPLAVRASVRERRATLEQVEAQAYVMRTPNLHLTEDFRESARAFVEKRKPVFHGR